MDYTVLTFKFKVDNEFLIGCGCQTNNPNNDVFETAPIPYKYYYRGDNMKNKI